jgi:hypothetical protein
VLTKIFLQGKIAIDMYLISLRKLWKNSIFGESKEIEVAERFLLIASESSDFQPSETVKTASLKTGNRLNYI